MSSLDENWAHGDCCHHLGVAIRIRNKFKDTSANEYIRMGPSGIVYRSILPLDTIGKQYTKFGGCCSNLKYQTGSKMIVPLMMMETHPSHTYHNIALQGMQQRVLSYIRMVDFEWCTRRCVYLVNWVCTFGGVINIFPWSITLLYYYLYLYNLDL